MTDRALFDFDFLQRHFPLVRRSQYQTGFGSGRCLPQMLPRIFDRGRSTCGIDTQFTRHFANNPLATVNHKGFVHTLRLKRVKRQGADKHGHVAIDAVVSCLL